MLSKIRAAWGYVGTQFGNFGKRLTGKGGEVFDARITARAQKKMENLNTARESALEALGTGASDEAKNAVNNRYDQLIQKTRARLAEDLSRTGGLAGILRRNPKKAAAAGLAGTAVTAAALGPGGRPVAMPTQSPEEAGAMAALEEMTAAHARPGDMYPGAPTLNQVSGGFTIPASAVGEYAPSRHAIGQQPHMS